MGKIRVHELAKKLGMSNQDLLTKLMATGLDVKTHSSNIDEAEAMRALQAAKQENRQKPRTVLRRRRPEDDLVPQAEEHNFEPSLNEPEQLSKEVLPQEISFAKPAEAQEQVSSQPVAREPQEMQVAEPQEVSTSFVQLPAANSQEDPKKQAHNVVRVIDANAIRERLRSEGRTFSRPRAPSRVREIRVVQNPGTSPQMFDVTQADASRTTAAAPSSPSAPRHQKRKDDRSGASYGNSDKREMKGGGYDLWMTPGRKKKNAKKGAKQTTITQAAAHKRVVELSGPITINDLAHRMSVKAGQVVMKLMGMGMMATVNQVIDIDTATLVAVEFEYEVKKVGFEETDILKEEQDAVETLQQRAPIVTVMGHVDHGKTSILDALRKANVAASEAGGITQHIGAYSVDTDHGSVTFLDTPGHEAFTSMRARGAQVTDIVVLVVAADDGMMPQTLEAIAHAKAAKVPVVVAINKMDVPGAKAERVMQQLSDQGLVPEEWGGDTQMFKVSALKGEGLKELMEGLINQAQMMELKANPDRLASGFVIEARLDKGRGPVATVLTQNGTLKQGEYLVAGEFMGRIRAMYDSKGDRVEQAGPSSAVQVLGLAGVPVAGDRFNAVEDDKAAKTISAHRAQKTREQELLQTSRVSLESFLQSKPEQDGHELRLIVKADVFGSVEALVAALKALTTRLVKVEVVHSGVGTITENDVNLAMASGAIIIGFNIKPDAKAQALAHQEKVDIRSYSIIYEALDEVRTAMAGLLTPTVEESYLGKAEVRVVFSSGKAGKVAGSYVLDGKIQRSSKVRILRGKQVLYTGPIGGLKRFKDDVKEVQAGYECGVAFDHFSDLKEGDIIECFEMKHVAAKLDEAIASVQSQAARLSSSSSPSAGV